MNRTIVCKACDNNRVFIDKVEQKLYIKCSNCKYIILQAVHFESWQKNIDTIYKLRINIEDDRLLEATIVERADNKKNLEISSKEEGKIRLIYEKKYEFIRQLELDEFNHTDV